MYQELIDRLRCDGLDAKLENTGGGIMVLFVKHPHGGIDENSEYGISAETDDDRYLLCYYPRGWGYEPADGEAATIDEPGVVAEELTAEQVVSFVRQGVV